MKRNKKMRHVLGWSIKKCGSFLKYIVLVFKTMATRYVFNNQKECSTLMFADGEIVNTFL